METAHDGQSNAGAVVNAPPEKLADLG